MPLQDIHLRKLLKIGFSNARSQRTALRTDIREEIAREIGDDEGGGDFYAPFWADAKAHAFGALDLRQAVDERIAANRRRANLYPQLRDGFLRWWGERRRLTNMPIQAGLVLKARFNVAGLAATVKVDSILSASDGAGTNRHIYPYFSPEPELGEDAARIGLWLLGQALPHASLQEIRILDVIQGRTFAVARTPLRGDEEERFRQMYEALIHERAELRREYD